MNPLTTEQIEAGLADVLASPKDTGTLELVLRRPDVEQREVLDAVELNVAEGVAGDNWNQRSSTRTDDGSPHPDMQLNVMNARFASLIAQTPERRQLAGDQLYIDMDISEQNMPPGTRLAIGNAVIEVTDQPHTGCKKFTQRFGRDAHRFVNSDRGKALRLRGLNARVVTEGKISTGDTITKL